MALAPEEIAHAFRQQGEWCVGLGSGLYGALCARIAQDIDARGLFYSLVADDPMEPVTSALALRVLGSIHRLVLEGRAPRIVAAGWSWEAVRATVEECTDRVHVLSRQPVQTNEVGRAGALVVGFAEAASAGRPLRLLEIGASAGLNLRFDAYGIRSGDRISGDDLSPVQLDPFVGEPPPLPPRFEVATRAGCDRRPVDPSTDEGRLTLLSYVWPDQRERLERLSSAIEIARSLPVPIERADAATWLGPKLATPAHGVSTVVFQSVVWQYLSLEEQQAVTQALEDAGARATHSAPLAWLRVEPGERRFEVRYRSWPGGDDRVLATSGPHGQKVHWRGPTAT